jgi:putative ABC transport system permease protein
VRMSPRWRKLRGDVGLAKGRLFMMIVAIAVGVFSVAAISSSYVILEREIGRNYLATNPAAALLEVESLDEKAVSIAGKQAGVTAAEAAGRFIGRVEVRADEWLPLLLFVLPDLSAMRISTVRLDSGRWPVTPDSLVLERTALPVANTAVDQKIRVQGSTGVQQSLKVTGAVHDPSLAPAWQEQTVYAYASPATLRLLGEVGALHVLKITVTDPRDWAGVERATIRVAHALQHAGYSVGEIRIPPYEHPHQSMMTSVIRMLLVFSALALILSALLTATLTTGFLAPQVRQIGVMKAIGARTSQIMQLYTVLIASTGILAVSVGLPLGIEAGRALAANTARLLNLELASQSVPIGLLMTQVVAGVGLPLAAATLPIWLSTKRTVWETLSDFGARLSSTEPGRLIRWISRLRTHDAAFVIAVRNSVRRRGRLAFTLLLLSTAGAMFITSINVKAAWERTLTQANAERQFDAEIRFAHEEPMAAVIAAASAVSGVHRVEPWSSEAASVARPDGLRIVKTYPDGGHGSLQIQSVPFNSAFIRPTITSGRWLNAADGDGVVMNEQALTKIPGSKIGDLIHLVVHSHDIGVRLIGIVREHLTQATLYIADDRYGRLTMEPGVTSGIRVALDRTDELTMREVTANMTSLLNSSGYQVAGLISRTQLGRALGGHLFILIFTLIVMSILMALVGLLGLSSATAIGVLERTREFAMMRVIGASGNVIRRSVIGEAVCVGVMSAAIALLLSVPLTRVVSGVVGTGSLGPSIETVISDRAMPLWLLIVVMGSVAASAYPAKRAAKLTIPEALTYQ